MGSANQEDKQRELSALAKMTLRHYKLATNFTTLEIGALGHYLPSEFASFKKLFPCITKTNICRLLDDCSKVALHGSYQIFLAS